MTTRSVGGGIIDLTRRDWQRDQLTAYYPGWPASGRLREFSKPLLSAAGDGIRAIRHPKSVTITCALKPAEGRPQITVRYTLSSGDDHVQVETVYSNPGTAPVSYDLVDVVRADRSFQKTPNGKADFFWAYDKWFGQAYGVLAPGREIQCASDSRYSRLRFIGRGGEGASEGRMTLAPQQKFTLERRIFPGHDLIHVKAIAAALRKKETVEVRLVVLETPGGNPVEGASVLGSWNGAGSGTCAAATDSNGQCTVTRTGIATSWHSGESPGSATATGIRISWPCTRWLLISDGSTGSSWKMPPRGSVFWPSA